MEAFVEAGGIFGNLTRAKHHKILVSVAALSNVDVLVMNSREFYAALEVCMIWQFSIDIISFV